MPAGPTIRDLAKGAAEARLQIVRAMGPGKFHHFVLGKGHSVPAVYLCLARCEVKG